MEQLPVCLFLFAGFTAVFSAVDKADTTFYVEAGSEAFTLQLPTDYKADPDDVLTWKRNGAMVSRSTGSQSGALVLPAKYLNVAGKMDVYVLEIYDKEGKQKLKKTTFLYLLEKVGTPSLSFICKDKGAVFTCNISQDLAYAWTVDNVKKSENSQTFKVQQKDFGKSVTCSVSNKAASKKSNAVKAECKAWYDTLYEDYTWYLVGGAGGLVLLLLFITVVCCVRARSRRKNRLQMESELRLDWTNQAPKQDQPQPQAPPQRKKKARSQQGGPQPHRCKASGDPHRPRHKDPTAAPLASNDAAAGAANPARPRPSPRPPQHERDSMPLVGMDHGPPLPKPRKKAPKTHTRVRPSPDP